LAVRPCDWKDCPAFPWIGIFFIPSRDLVNIGKINTILGDILDLPLEPLGPKGENFIQTYQIQCGIIQFHLGGPGLPPFDEAEAAAVRHQTEMASWSIVCVLAICWPPRRRPTALRIRWISNSWRKTQGASIRQIQGKVKGAYCFSLDLAFNR